MSAEAAKLSARERLVFPLDVETLEAALQFVDQLKRDVGVFKVGKQLFVQSGPKIVQAIHDRGCEVFLDLKFHDIPNTVAGAIRATTALGPALLNVHASGGPDPGSIDIVAPADIPGQTGDTLDSVPGASA